MAGHGAAAGVRGLLQVKAGWWVNNQESGNLGWEERLLSQSNPAGMGGRGKAGRQVGGEVGRGKRSSKVLYRAY